MALQTVAAAGEKQTRVGDDMGSGPGAAADQQTLLFTRVMIRYQQMSTTLDIKLYQGDFHL